MSERETLLARAKELEISHAANISDEKLKAKISAAEAKVKAEDLITVQVLDALKHNGENYGPGTDRETVDLTPKELVPLEACGVVQRLPQD